MAHSFSTPGLKVFPFFPGLFFFILFPNHFRCCPRRIVGVQCTRVELKFLSNLSIPFLPDKFNGYTPMLSVYSFQFSIYSVSFFSGVLIAPLFFLPVHRMLLENCFNRGYSGVVVQPLHCFAF